MSKKKEIPVETNAVQPVVVPPKPQPVKYTFSREEQSTPYYAMMKGSYRAKAGSGTKASFHTPAIGGKNGAGHSFRSDSDLSSLPEAIAIPDEPKKPVKCKRTFFLILIFLFSLLYVVYSVLSFFRVMPEYTSYAQVGFENQEDKELVEESLGKDEFLQRAYMGLDDLVWSSLAKFFNIAPGAEENVEMEAEAASDDAVASKEEADVVEVVEPNEHYFYYYMILNPLGERENTAVKIALYAVPAAYLLSVLVALYILIKSFFALIGKKRRTFVGAGATLFVLALLGFVAMFVAAANVSELALGDILGYLMMQVAEGTRMALTASIGVFVTIGLGLLTLIASLFAYKSRKKAGDVREKKPKKSKKR